MRAFLTIFLSIILAACRGSDQEPDQPKTAFYLGLGPFAPKFEEGIPSFGGDEWGEVVSVNIDGVQIAEIDKGGHSLYIESANKHKILSIRRGNPVDYDLYIMAYKVNTEGVVDLLWKGTISGDKLTEDFNLWTGERP
jgi:hypothetical protein